MSKSQADYIDAVRQEVENIGRSGPSSVPLVNDPITSVEQEYAIASILFKFASERKDAARNAVLAAHQQLPPAYGQHVLDDNRFVVVTVQVRKGPLTLGREAVRGLLVKEFNLSIEAADKLIGEYSKQSPDQYIITALLKQ